MSAPEIKPGDRIGALVVVGESDHGRTFGSEPRAGRHFVLRCDCGLFVHLSTAAIRRGKRTACSCCDHRRRRRIDHDMGRAANYHLSDSARRTLLRAVASGEVVRPDACETCGRDDARIFGHHEDYAKPLEVQWLCAGCHARRHVALREEHLRAAIAEDDRAHRSASEAA